MDLFAIGIQRKNHDKAANSLLLNLKLIEEKMKIRALNKYFITITIIYFKAFERWRTEMNRKRALAEEKASDKEMVRNQSDKFSIMRMIELGQQAHEQNFNFASHAQLQKKQEDQEFEAIEKQVGLDIKTDMINVQEKKQSSFSAKPEQQAKKQKMKKKKKTVNLASLGVPLSSEQDPSFQTSPIKGLPLPIDMTLLEEQVTEIYAECEEKADAPDFFFVPSRTTMQAIILRMMEEEFGSLEV